MTFASIIVPAYNAARTLPETIEALLAQTHDSFEIIIINDGSTDETIEISNRYGADEKIRVVHQRNRGLAGARNSGIHAAAGEFIGFCDADDIWQPEKLAQHIAHLRANPSIGLSYSGSLLIDDLGAPLGQTQSPKLTRVDTAHVFKRNPIGNGSAVIVRRDVFRDIAYRPNRAHDRDWYFDETFRQSEDIECWLRIALTTNWEFQGIKGHLTQYRINANGLSASIENQLQAWEQMVEKLQPLDPDFFAEHLPAARAYQHRYLCRRALKSLDVTRAHKHANDWMRSSARPFLEEPLKSAATWGALQLMSLCGATAMQRLFTLIASTNRQGAA
ncbi:Glycosyl transferase family 2 [Aliiroseovarius halocynthiae]|uniref:Glycosyltransferase family 2 protein n=1 Tax=Aliiroseovarius halocynthiae TaxID=985055 RepID=A0A545SWQ7_9RHOB|nr:glycosyltransferase family A protein [Aliiroseovarius halocynthiae]TQV69389.1 glycosyltransferase family 2 protein [Aliiroseovarius halocynthiae]SMR72778.1 Glycosyl transferase family 2 [Aliiroseovarius halocynthiae]